jgi:hypothetical protein
MTRPPRQPPRADVDPGDVAAFDRVIERAGNPDRQVFVNRQQADGGGAPVEQDAGYYGRLLLSPQLAHHLSEIGRIVRGLGDRSDSYTHAERELVDQVLSADLGTNVIQLHHIPDAVTAGVRVEAIQALRAGREEELDETERELAAFIRQVVGGTVSDDAWTALEARRGERWPVDYAIFTLFLQMTMRLQQVVGMPEPPDAEVDALIADIAAGSRPSEPFVNRAG